MTYSNSVKRCLDVILALLILVITLPVIILVSVLLAINNDGKVIFVQARPGKGQKVFNLFKFKTMNDRKNAHGELLPDSERLTGIGQLVRKSSLDELPQLINVLRGEMSLVGPRPLLVEYLPLYNERQSRRHIEKPGITGWAQVNGRNAISWEQKFEYDVWYVENISFKLDIKIIGMTISRVLRREGVSSGTSVTMEKFKGTI